MIIKNLFSKPRRKIGIVRTVFSKLINILIILVFLISAVGLKPATAADTPETSITPYYDGRAGAMAINYDTELYLCGMLHSMNGYDPATAAGRAQLTRTGWLNILADTEAQGIPVSFNICGFESVFGNTGPAEIADINVTYDWHSDPYWSSHTWYSDLPSAGGNYLMTGDLSGTNRSYNLVYGGDLTERTMNSSVPFEISYHSFGHESSEQSHL